MKKYRILADFKGSQDGHDHHQFKADTEAHLSDDLAAIVLREGWAEPLPGTVISDVELAETRETKVTEPKAKKVLDIKSKKAKAA